MLRVLLYAPAGSCLLDLIQASRRNTDCQQVKNLETWQMREAIFFEQTLT